MEHLSSDAGYSYLGRDYCLGDISECEGGFSYWGSCCSPISLQGIGQFFKPGPVASSILVLIILSSVRLVTSVFPFACRCPGVENWFLIPRLEQKSLKPLL